MRTRKILLLASMALATVALAGPANASAAKWLHEGKPVEEKVDKTVKLTGTLTFIVEPGTSVKCQAHPIQTITGPNNSEFTSYGITTESCIASGTYQGCKMTEDHKPGPGGSPLDPVNATTFIVTNFMLTGKFKCGSELLEEELAFSFSFGEVIATPDVPKAMKSLELLGEGTITMGEEETSGELEGELEYVGADSGTYGIG
jgi:hypothetical protein